MVTESPIKVKRTCQHCGHRGYDVSLHLFYVGGEGEVIRIYCDDGKACWKRWADQTDKEAA